MAQMTYSNGSGCFHVTGYTEEMGMENLSGYVKGVGRLVRWNTYQQCFWRWWFGEGMKNEWEKNDEAEYVRNMWLHYGPHLSSSHSLQLRLTQQKRRLMDSPYRKIGFFLHLTTSLVFKNRARPGRAMMNFRAKEVRVFLSKLPPTSTFSFTIPDDDTDFMNNSKIVTSVRVSLVYSLF